MSKAANVVIHESQFPEAVRFDLLESLRKRRINHKFHYDSVKQTQKWLALHQAYSPSRTDPDCAATYQRSFDATAGALPRSAVHLIGLGCGGGQKDTALLRLLHASGHELFYTPCDVSAAMVLVARATALQAIPESHCFPLVCDLATTQDLPELVAQLIPRPTPLSTTAAAPFPKRVFTFFGMLPNFEPDSILPKLADVVGPGDSLLLSANLAPGGEYGSGVERVLPLYDNDLTRDWLMTFLLDLGIEKSDGDLRFTVEERSIPLSLKRIAADFHFLRRCTVEVDVQRFEFEAGEQIRLFYSYRHTPSLVRALLDQYGLQVTQERIVPSQEEGVFHVARR